MDDVAKRDPIYISIPLKETPSGQSVGHLDHDLSFYTKYLNHSGRDIVVGLRNGLTIKLPSRADRYKKTIIIREELFISDRIKNTVRDKLLNYEGIMGDELIAFAQLFTKEYENQPHHVTLRYDYDVPSSTLIKNGGTTYLIEKDIILSTELNNIPLHPFCPEALSRPLAAASQYEGSASVWIVDNRKVIGPRYIRLLNKVIKVDSIVDSLSRDGVYITHRNWMNDNQSIKSFTEYVPDDKIDTLTWLHKTFAEAKSSPERELELSMELKQLDHESRRISATTSVQKSEYDLEKLALERNNASLQQVVIDQDRRNAFFENEWKRKYAHEEHHSKLEQLKSKDFYESRSSERKDSSEWVKIVPAMLVGAGAAFIALKGLFTK